MTEKRFDIVVQDKVARSIKTELASIGAAARTTRNDINQLYTAMGLRASSAASQAQSAATRTVAASARVTAAEARASASQTAKTAKVKASLETEAQQHERLAAVVERAARRQEAAAARSAAAFARASSSSGTLLLGSKSLASRQMPFMRGSGAGGGDDPLTNPATAATAARNAQAIGQVGASSQMAAHHTANLAFQLNDIFVSLASGQRPLMVFIQQGAQIGQIASQAGLGLGGMASAIARMLLPFTPLIVLLTAAAALLGSLKHQANEGETGLKHFTKEMGYTASEVKKLNAVTVSWGDTAKAIFQVGMARIASAFGISVDGMASAWKSFLDFMASATRATLSGVYAGFITLAKLTNPGLMSSLENGSPIDDLKKNYNDAQNFFDDVIKKSQSNARSRQDQMASEMFNAPHQKKGGGKQGFDRAKEWRDANEELDGQIKLLGLYGEALERAQQIEQIGRTFREHNVPLTAAEVQILNDKIQKLQEGRRVQEAMTAAEEEANGPQRRYADTQEALNRLLASGAITAEDWTNQMFLAGRALEDATDPLAALNRELQRSGELMGLYGRDRDVATYIQQLQQAAEAKGGSIFQRPLGPSQVDANGNIVVTGGRGALTPEAQSMVDEFRQQQERERYTQALESTDRSQRINPSDPSYLLDHYKELYAEIDRLRQTDVFSEEEAMRRKKELDVALGDARLAAASSMFGQLASLQNSHVKEVAAIGKAAAIAQATIDGYRAVQAALAGPPGPPWSFAIAGVTAVMTAANVARIAGIGFETGGYTGNLGTKTPAGVVHGQEYVFDAASTRRIGVPALDAMRNGRLNSAPSNDNRAGPRVSVYPGAGVYTEVVERTDGEIEIIAERAVRRAAPDAVAKDLHNPNGRTSKALGLRYGLRSRKG